MPVKQRKSLGASVASKFNGQRPGSPFPCTCFLGQPENPAMFTIRQVVVSIGQAKGPQARAQCHRLSQEQEGHIIATFWVGVGPMQNELLQAPFLWSSPQSYTPFL